MQVLCSYASQPPKNWARLAVSGASARHGAVTRQNPQRRKVRSCAHRERQKKPAPPSQNHPNEARRQKEGPKYECYCCCCATNTTVHTTAATMAPHCQLSVLRLHEIDRSACFRPPRSDERPPRTRTERAARARPRPPATCHLLRTPHTARLPLAGQ